MKIFSSAGNNPFRSTTGIGLALFVTFLLILPASASDKTETASSPPKVLIVTPDPQTGYAKGIADLLKENRVKSRIASWEQAAPARVKGFDLVLITGLGRRPDRRKVRLDFPCPVLAVGPYGCKVLGTARLKNGHPYT